jgi:hypothetical protein
MLYFASVASICDDTISYRTKTDHGCVSNLVEGFQNEDSLFHYEQPSWTGLIAGGTSSIGQHTESYVLKTNSHYPSK